LATARSSARGEAGYGMIDLHTHVLPALDDGARNLAESVEIAAMAGRAGVRTIVATPHIRYDYPFEPAEIDARAADLNRELAAVGVPVDVVPGAEIAQTEIARLSDADLRQLSLGRSGRYLLLETPYRSPGAGALESFVRGLASRGFRVVLAHPERNVRLLEPAQLDRLIALGALLQLTAGSLTGDFGGGARDRAVDLLRQGRAHVLGSDSHRADVRPLALATVAGSILPTLVTEEECRAILVERPQAILAGAEIELPPPTPVRRSLRKRFALGGR